MTMKREQNMRETFLLDPRRIFRQRLSTFRCNFINQIPEKNKINKNRNTYTLLYRMLLNNKKKTQKTITGALVHEWPLERVSSGIYICRANIATLWTLYYNVSESSKRFSSRGEYIKSNYVIYLSPLSSCS